MNDPLETNFNFNQKPPAQQNNQGGMESFMFDDMLAAIPAKQTDEELQKREQDLLAGLNFNAKPLETSMSMDPQTAGGAAGGGGQ
jgi:hypothetical protein